MDSKKKANYSPWFYAIGGAAVAGLISSAYYIFTLFQDEEEQLNDQQQEMVEKLNEKMIENKKSGKEELDVETAIQIMNLTNKLAEEMYQRKYPNADSERRKLLKDKSEEEYITHCYEYLQRKEEQYVIASESVLSHFKGYTFQEIHNLMNTCDPATYERISSKFDIPEFKKPMPASDKVKKAYIEYGNLFIQEMTLIQSQFMNNRTNPSPVDQQQFLAQLYIVKIKVDDMIYNGHEISENEMKYLLSHYNLMIDQDIVDTNRKLMAFNSLMQDPNSNDS